MQVGRPEQYDEPPRYFVYHAENENELDAREYCPMTFAGTASERWKPIQWRNKHSVQEVAEWYAEVYYDESAGEGFNCGRSPGENFIVVDKLENKAVKIFVNLEWNPSFWASMPEEIQVDLSKVE